MPYCEHNLLHLGVSSVTVHIILLPFCCAVLMSMRQSEEYRYTVNNFRGFNFRGLGSSGDFVVLFFRGVPPLIT